MKLVCIRTAKDLTPGTAYEGTLLEKNGSASRPATDYRFLCYNDAGKWQTYNPVVFKPIDPYRKEAGPGEYSGELIDSLRELLYRAGLAMHKHGDTSLGNELGFMLHKFGGPRRG